MAAMQNVIGVGVAYALGQHPLMGVLAGSVTLTGGPATDWRCAAVRGGRAGRSHARGCRGHGGIVSGGIVGGPVATWLLTRLGRQPRSVQPRGAETRAEHVVEAHAGEPPSAAPAGEDIEAYGLLKALVLILVAMWLGSILSAWFVSLGATFPCLHRRDAGCRHSQSLDDAAKLVNMSQRTIDDLGATALSCSSRR